MILGVLSDTHGQARRAANAIRLLKEVGAEALVHCGDVGGEKVLDCFAGLKAWLVRGNTDPFDRGIAMYASMLGVTFTDRTPLELSLAGKSLAVFHGHELAFARLLDGAAEAPSAPAKYQYILHGHTHVAADSRVGGYRVINPGALQRAAEYSVATIDLATDTVSHWVVTDADSQKPRRMPLEAP